LQRELQVVLRAVALRVTRIRTARRKTDRTLLNSKACARFIASELVPHRKRNRTNTLCLHTKASRLNNRTRRTATALFGNQTKGLKHRARLCTVKRSDIWLLRLNRERNKPGNKLQPCDTPKNQIENIERRWRDSRHIIEHRDKLSSYLIRIPCLCKKERHILELSKRGTNI
jgi:hypothetical protein